MNEKKSGHIQYQKLKWACRRGMLELDLFLLPFLEQAFTQLDREEQDVFVALLSLQDPVIYAWLLGHETPDEEKFSKLIIKIKENAKKKP